MTKKHLSSMYKNALVTGASSGLGKAFSEMLVCENIEVLGTSRAEGKIKKDKGINTIQLDLLSETSVNALLRKIKSDELQIDLLINNAGSGVIGDFETLPEQKINEQINLLLRNQIKLTQACFKKMSYKGRGSIVNVSSMAAEYPIPYMSMYNASKAGLSIFTQSLMLESDRIKLIDLQPGDFDTNFRIERSEILGKNAKRAYCAMSERTKHSPNAKKASNQLKNILRKSKSGTYRVGSFGQAKLYPALLNFLPRTMVRRVLKSYYGL